MSETKKESYRGARSKYSERLKDYIFNNSEALIRISIKNTNDSIIAEQKNQDRSKTIEEEILVTLNSSLKCGTSV